MLIPPIKTKLIKTFKKNTVIKNNHFLLCLAIFAIAANAYAQFPDPTKRLPPTAFLNYTYLYNIYEYKDKPLTDSAKYLFYFVPDREDFIYFFHYDAYIDSIIHIGGANEFIESCPMEVFSDSIILSNNRLYETYSVYTNEPTTSPAPTYILPLLDTDTIRLDIGNNCCCAIFSHPYNCNTQLTIYKSAEGRMKIGRLNIDYWLFIEESTYNADGFAFRQLLYLDKSTRQPIKKLIYRKHSTKSADWQLFSTWHLTSVFAQIPMLTNYYAVDTSRFATKYETTLNYRKTIFIDDDQPEDRSYLATINYELYTARFALKKDGIYYRAGKKWTRYYPLDKRPILRHTEIDNPRMDWRNTMPYTHFRKKGYRDVSIWRLPDSSKSEDVSVTFEATGEIDVLGTRRKFYQFVETPTPKYIEYLKTSSSPNAYVGHFRQYSYYYIIHIYIDAETLLPIKRQIYSVPLAEPNSQMELCYEENYTDYDIQQLIYIQR
jgi:hypothetical protein